MATMDRIEERYARKDLPRFGVGDTVDVRVLIKEGEKERIQVYNGTVIRLRGRGMGTTFTVRRIVQGQGVERTFPLHSPFVKGVVVKRTGAVRRAKLYYLRDRTGKATRLRGTPEGARGEEPAQKVAEPPPAAAQEAPEPAEKS
jgi:large subunit ribosomal protein L19